MAKQYSGIDILKILLMFLVVCIHFDPLQGADGVRYLRYPIILCAVPLYFISSSFLFFSKYESSNSKEHLLHFIKRNALLYISWFIILLIPTVIIRGYFFSGSIFTELRRLVVDILLGSTFRNSWFIVALIIGTVIVCFLSKYIGNIGTLVIGLLLYILCCLASDYGNTGLLGGVLSYYPRTIYQSFPISVMWITCGKIVADNETKISNISLKVKSGIAIISCAGMFVEFIVLDKTYGIMTEAYGFMMIPFCFSLFCLIFDRNVTIKNVKYWRHWTTVTYCFHTTFAWVICKVLDKIGMSYTFPFSILIYVIILGACFGLTAAFIGLSKYKLFRWIKWAM